MVQVEVDDESGSESIENESNSYKLSESEEHLIQNQSITPDKISNLEKSNLETKTIVADVKRTKSMPMITKIEENDSIKQNMDL